MDIALLIIAIILCVLGKWTTPILILLTLATDYWGLWDSVSEVVFTHSLSDTALILMVCMILIVMSRKVHIQLNEAKTLKTIIIVFWVFLTSSILIDMISRGTSYIDVIRTARQFLFIPGAFILFRYIPFKHYDNIFSGIVLINGICCVLCILQYFHIISFLVFVPDELSWVQLYIPDGLLISAILLLSPFGKQYNPFVRYGLLGLCFIVSILSTIRSFNAALILCVMLIYVFSTRRILISRVLTCIITVLFVLGAILANDRFEEKINKTNYDIEEGSFAVRENVYDTAIDIVTNNIGNIIIGSGWHAIEGKQYGEYKALDSYEAAYLTSDISWSPLLLRLGIVGTIIYTLIWLFFMIYGWRNRKTSDAGLILSVYTVGSFIISIAGPQLYSMKNILIPVLLFYISLQQIKSSQTNIPPDANEQSKDKRDHIVI